MCQRIKERQQFNTNKLPYIRVETCFNNKKKKQKRKQSDNCEMFPVCCRLGLYDFVKLTLVAFVHSSESMS